MGLLLALAQGPGSSAGPLRPPGRQPPPHPAGSSFWPLGVPGSFPEHFTAPTHWACDREGPSFPRQQGLSGSPACPRSPTDPIISECLLEAGRGHVRAQGRSIHSAPLTPCTLITPYPTFPAPLGTAATAAPLGSRGVNPTAGISSSADYRASPQEKHSSRLAALQESAERPLGAGSPLGPTAEQMVPTLMPTSSQE